MITQVIQRGPLNSIIDMLTSLQLIVHSPLLNVQFPANAFLLYEEMIRMVTFEAVPTAEIYPQIMDFPDKGYFNEKFDRLDYGSHFSIMILGTLFLVMCWMVLLYVIFLLLLLCRVACVCPTNLIKALKKTLFWKQWIIFSYANFLEILIILALQAMIVGDDWMLTSWVFTSFLIWILLAILSISIIFTTFVIVCRYLPYKEHKGYLKKNYGLLVNNLRKKRDRSVMLTHANYFIQRIVLVIVTVCLNHLPIFQILILMYTDLLAALVTAHIWPEKSRAHNWNKLFDDMTLVMIISCLICCTDLITDGEARYAVGFFIVILTL